MGLIGFTAVLTCNPFLDYPLAGPNTAIKSMKSMSRFGGDFPSSKASFTGNLPASPGKKSTEGYTKKSGPLIILSYPNRHLTPQSFAACRGRTNAEVQP